MLDKIALYTRYIGQFSLILHAFFAGFSRGGLNINFVLLVSMLIIHCLATRKNPFGNAPSSVWIGFFLFSGLFLLNTALSNDPKVSLRELAVRIYLLAALPAALTFADNPKLRKGLCLLMACSVIIGAIIATYQAYPRLAVVRAKSHLGIMEYGGVLGLMIPFLAMQALLYLKEKKYYWAWLFLGAFFMGLLGLLFNGTRIVWVGASISLLVVFLFNLRGLKRIHWLIIALALTIMFTWGTSRQGAFDRLLSITNITSDTSNLMRITMWKYGWGVFLDHPIFGVGLGALPGIGFNKEWGLGSISTSSYYHVHSVWLTLAAETGIMGLIGYSALFVPTILLALRNLRNRLPWKRGWAVILTVVVLEYFIHSFTDQVFGLKPLMYLLWFLIGLAWLELWPPRSSGAVSGE